MIMGSSLRWNNLVFMQWHDVGKDSMSTWGKWSRTVCLCNLSVNNSSRRIVFLMLIQCMQWQWFSWGVWNSPEKCSWFLKISCKIPYREIVVVSEVSKLQGKLNVAYSVTWTLLKWKSQFLDGDLHQRRRGKNWLYLTFTKSRPIEITEPKFINLSRSTLTHNG